MSRATQAIIDLSALRENYLIAKKCAPRSRIYAVMKANAYGHGLLRCSNALLNLVDGFAVACVEEAQKLREDGISLPILVLEGPMDEAEYGIAIELDLELVIHHKAQVDWVKAAPNKKRLWIKVDTGMHRLGFDLKDVPLVVGELEGGGGVSLISHFACADKPSDLFNTHQMLQMSVLAPMKLPTSMSNSAAILKLPQSHGDMVRPGIMLYGSSPLLDSSAFDLGLKPVMTLQSNVIALHYIRKGESVGYGRHFVAQKDTQIAVVAIGYGDGYPRSATLGTPVLIQGRKWPLVGRVCMDMITIDVSGGNIQIGDMVTLWGEGLSADEIARQCGTISYELFCQITSRVKMHYLGDDDTPAEELKRNVEFERG